MACGPCGENHNRLGPGTFAAARGRQAYTDYTS